MDSYRRRWADSFRPYKTALKRFAGYSAAYHYTLPLYVLPGTGLHDPATTRAAALVSAATFGSFPARWKVEEAPGAGLHLHAVTPCPPQYAGRYAHVRRVEGEGNEYRRNLRKVLAYHAKPAAAALCKPTPYQYATTPQEERRAAALLALQEQADARRARLAGGYTRLAPVAGWTGHHAQRVPPAPAALVLALLVLALKYTSATEEMHRPRPGLPQPPRRAAAGGDQHHQHHTPPRRVGGRERTLSGVAP